MPLKTHQADQPTLNLTPMIDIVFLVIIFFMVGTQFTQIERRIGLQIPEVSRNAALTAAPEKRVVSIFRDGQITLDRESVTLDQLSARLSEAHRQCRDLGVLIRGDAQSSFQFVADVLNACKQAGISELGISVKIAVAN